LTGGYSSLQTRLVPAEKILLSFYQYRAIFKLGAIVTIKRRKVNLI